MKNSMFRRKGVERRTADADPGSTKKKSDRAAKSSVTTTYNPEVPRHRVEIPGPASRHSAPGRVSDLHNRTLIVGRDICVTGEITSCDRLVVEGTVEVALSDAHTIEITSTGHFRGNATVESADISGRFDGQLTVKGKLTVRSGGQVSGSIRYATVVIESGGEISGDMETIAEGPVSELPVPGDPAEAAAANRLE